MEFNQVLLIVDIEVRRLKSFPSDKELVIYALNTVKDSKDPQSLICSES